MRVRRVIGTAGIPAALAVVGSVFAGGHAIDPCPWDLNGDRVVDTKDFLEVIALWGTDPGGPPDVNCREHFVMRDGVVDSRDFLDFLMHWGPCQ